MISLSVALHNPFAKQDWDNVKCWSKLLTKHKAVEAEILRDNQMLIDVSARISIRQDHAGAELCVGIWKYSVSIKLYDTRHWDNKTNAWAVYDV